MKKPKYLEEVVARRDERELVRTVIGGLVSDLNEADIIIGSAA